MKRGGTATLRRLLPFVVFSIIFLPTLLLAEIDPQYQQGVLRVSERLRSEGFAEEELVAVLGDPRVTLYPELLERRGKGLDYFSRKFGLLTKKSVERGVQVLKSHMAVLKRIEEDYGVEREVIVAILRVETNFGSYTGKYPVFNSLLTRAVIENRRSQWAEDELVFLLRMAREQGKDPLGIKGSWAGAFGIPQFVPSSYVRFAVDGNGDNTIDLYDFSDSLASVANYLKSHGWEKGNSGHNRQAVYAYNHCDNYVQAVFAYARAIGKKQRGRADAVGGKQ
jgi:membrane-bound lytic murein transglycosylase B